MHWNIADFLVLNKAFGSTALRIATSVFLFIARIRFAVSDSLIDVLRTRYGRGLVKEVRIFEKIDFTEKLFTTFMPEQLNTQKSTVLQENASKTLNSLQYLTIYYSVIEP